MNKKKWMALWESERDEVLKSYDLERFKALYEKWKARGFYALSLPRDEVIEVSMRKMVYNLKSSTEAEKEEAKKWLLDRGFTTEVE